MSKIRFPLKVLKPLRDYLSGEEKKLVKRKKELSKEDPFENPDRVNDNAAIDTDAAEEAGHERITALKKEIDRALISVRKTLTKIKIGKYGMCESCQKLIDTDRLAVNPTATHCMKCVDKKK
jgi:RNA polymerase-binding transcription factor DksA